MERRRRKSLRDALNRRRIADDELKAVSARLESSGTSVVATSTHKSKVIVSSTKFRCFLRLRLRDDIM